MGALSRACEDSCESHETSQPPESAPQLIQLCTTKVANKDFSIIAWMLSLKISLLKTTFFVDVNIKVNDAFSCQINNIHKLNETFVVLFDKALLMAFSPSFTLNLKKVSQFVEKWKAC